MAVSLEWYDNRERILIFTFAGKWTWEELQPVVERSRQMTMATQHGQLVHTIVDMRNAALHIPAGVLLNMKSIAENQTPKSGITVLVTEDRGIHMLFNTLMSGLRAAYRPASIKFERHFTIRQTMTDGMAVVNDLLQMEPA